jgi:uncharacterized membrane protein YozB (DUF420 family)
MISRPRVKLLLSLYFLFLSIVLLPVFLPGSFIQEASVPKVSLIAEMTFRLICLILGLLFITAGWMALKHRNSDNHSAATWALAASVTGLAVFTVIPLTYLARGGTAIFLPVEAIFGIPQAAGIIGVVVFRHRTTR